MDEKQFEDLPSLGELMAEHVLSFSDLQHESGVARSTIEDIVYGNTKSPQSKTMRAIAKVFGVEPKKIREFAIAIELRKLQLGKDLPVATLISSTGRQNKTAAISPIAAVFI